MGGESSELQLVPPGSETIPDEACGITDFSVASNGSGLHTDTELTSGERDLSLVQLQLYEMMNHEPFADADFTEDTNVAVAGSSPERSYLTNIHSHNLSPVKMTPLYKLMSINTDRQDLSFVEKVIIPKDEILRFCNDMLPNSTKITDTQQIHIDFNLLNGCSFAVTGYYGDKDMMIEIFRSKTILDSEVLSAMELGRFGPGLYAAVEYKHRVLHVFYWHEGQKFMEASRRDLSCNFIRYLVDICDPVHICLKDQDFPKSVHMNCPRASVPVTQRTKRLQVSRLKASEDDFLVSPGFEVGMKETFLQQGRERFQSEFLLSEGLFRFALLASRCQSRKPDSVVHKKIFKFDDMHKIVGDWRHTFDLNVDDLPDEQFHLLLLAIMPEVSVEYQTLQESLRNEQEARKRKQNELQSILEKVEENISKGLYRALEEYVEKEFPWEERKLSVTHGKGSKAWSDRRSYRRLPSYRVAFSVLESSCSERVQIVVSFADKKLYPPVEVGREGLDSQDIWRLLDFLAKNIMPRLQTNACFLTLLMNKSKTIEDKLDEKTIVTLLEAGTLDSLRKRIYSSLGEAVVTEIETNYQEQPDLYSNCAEHIHPKVAAVAANLYAAGKDNLQVQIRDMVQNKIIPLLRKKVKEEATKDLGTVDGTKSLKAFYSSYRQKFTQKNGSRPSLSIKEVKEHKLSWVESFFSPFYTKHGNVHVQQLLVTFQTQEVEKEYLTWEAYELVPMKKDLETLNSNPKSRVHPVISKSEIVVHLEVGKENLYKFVLLKSGEGLIFIESIANCAMTIYHCTRLGNLGMKPVHAFRRKCDLVAFDERSHFMAIYERPTSIIKIYAFDEPFKNCDWIGVDIYLTDFSGSPNITWMEFIPGKREIILADDTRRVRVFELTQPVMMKPKHICLSSSLTKACISADGSCLISMHTSDNTVVITGSSIPSSEDMARNQREPAQSMLRGEKKRLAIDVYRLGDSLSYLKSDILETCIDDDILDIEARVFLFGPQMHLVIHSPQRNGILKSHVLEILSASEVLKLQEVKKAVKGNREISESSNKQDCPPLDYIFHIFEKYAVNSPLGYHRTSIDICILFKGNQETMGMELTESLCKDYISHSIERLKAEKGKDFAYFQVNSTAHNLQFWLLKDLVCKNQFLMGSWVCQLVCLVPIQIARAENNTLRPLVDGLEMPGCLSCPDSVTLSSAIRFGFYDTILSNWKGCIKVLSSMGKQSSGKSYLLNHLAGSFFDVAGGRCTDGVWMTIRPGNNCLYVLLDFEGLGSFERTIQEDILLSVLNAAVSNITLFNKRDFHLDKETEAVFDRFQSGMSLVKEDGKLFKGLFCIAIKDVDISDVEELTREFYAKINQICSKSQENFLTKMYSGEVEIAVMPPYHLPEYYYSIEELASTIHELRPCYQDGRSFINDLKLVIAQISAKDWSPMDSKRVALRLYLIRQHLNSAIKMGCLAHSLDNAFAAFDSQVEVPDGPIEVGGHSFAVRDTGLELAPFEESKVLGDILENLRGQFEKVMKRTGMDDESWFTLLEMFLVSVVDRRKIRVLEWVHLNTSEFPDNGDLQKLDLEICAAIAEMKQLLSICGCKCGKCFLKCILEKGHSSHHSCMGSHTCTYTCTYCVEEQECSGVVARDCNDLAGHEGPHDCKERSHTCGKPCDLSYGSSNCNVSCSYRIGHDGPHKCNSSQHMCKMTCSAPDCQNTCVVPVEFGEHTSHTCHLKFCLKKCCMDGCPRSCATEDHFHALKVNAKHFCENEHPCRMKCEAQGICEVITEMVKQTRSFHGKRATFEYDYTSEQNGVKKGCCLAIPPFKDKHDGAHTHTTRDNVVHFCDSRCQTCGYFCHLPMGHLGLHSTVHGNMRLTRFVAETEEIDLDDRQYTWGESGLAEMCMVHCKSRGRGHIHLIICPEHQGGVCTGKLYEGARHETMRYGPDYNTPKDEMTHETYWRHIRFADPCTEEEQEEFALCNCYCRSDEHQLLGASGLSIGARKDDETNRSYCTERLWHAPIAKVGLFSQACAGYVSSDGHHFSCDHTKNVPHHVVFVIDKSGSMSSSDIRPTFTKLQNHHNNRLGCVFEAILRFVRARRLTVADDTVSVVLFDTSAYAPIQLQDMDDDLLEKLSEDRQCSASGGTTYSAGIGVAETLIERGAREPALQGKNPVIIFLSDGGNNGGHDPLYCVNKIKRKAPSAVFHTIMYGKDSTVEILKEMAKAGGGIFQLSLDEVQLARSFEDLALSLRTKTAALLQQQS